MTLFSNSSLGFYSDNKTSSFTVQLPRQMCLSGEWKVALTEIQYPYSFLNTLKVTDDIITFIKENKTKNTSSAIESKFKVETRVCSIEASFYTDNEKLISAVNEAITKTVELNDNSFEFFILDKNAEKLTATPPAASATGSVMITSLAISDRLALQLGYIPDQRITDTSSVANHAVNLISGIPDKMLIYCDIIEPQICGDIWSKILRSVSIHSNPHAPYFGLPCSKEFTQLQYIPVQLKHFDSISIDIRDISGELMPFQFGTLSVKLHFKQF
ncbi:hypothetical protein HA402_009417 [Bradysia odoriphaga]|nr:hypothetical protein HA402_009417 [Bradysia odoriphaga]